MSKADNVKLHSIDDVIKALQTIKEKYNNLSVAQINYYEDYPIEITSVLPCVVTNPVNKSEYLVIFD